MNPDPHVSAINGGMPKQICHSIRGLLKDSLPNSSQHIIQSMLYENMTWIGYFQNP